jgi:hypothetical protein
MPGGKGGRDGAAEGGGAGVGGRRDAAAGGAGVASRPGSPPCSPTSSTPSIVGCCTPTPPGGSCAGYATAAQNTTGRSPTSYPRTQLIVASRFLAWLDSRGVALGECRQAHVDDWLTEGSAGYPIRDFLG